MNDEAAIPGIDVEPVTAWFTEHTSAQPPLTFELIAGGRSNLTFRVQDQAGGDWVLRLPDSRWQVVDDDTFRVEWMVAR